MAKKRYEFPVIIERDEDGIYVATAPSLPGCHTQAKTHDELIKRTKEAIKLYLKCKKPEDHTPKFLGLQQIELNA